MNKPKVAFYWCASCGGCEETVVDLAEEILTVVAAVDIVFWPVALDFKREDVEAMPDASITVSFINGAVRTSEQEEMARLLRRKSRVVVAFGSCAHLGGIPALANLTDLDSIMRTAYIDTVSTVNPDCVLPRTEVTVPEGTLTLPSLWKRVFALDEVIDVDYYLPGCTVPPTLLMAAVRALLEGNLPPKGTVLAPDKTNCDTCKRNTSKPEKLEITRFHRPHEIELDEEQCFIAQGVICLGPATRGGCGERCIEGNMPCRGCMGPVDRVHDQGAKFVSVLASLFAAKEEADIGKLVDSIADPTGTFYRFSLFKSYLKGKV